MERMVKLKLTSFNKNLFNESFIGTKGSDGMKGPRGPKGKNLVEKLSANLRSSL